MSAISELNVQERVFLAGCIEALILANSQISREELNDLDRITTVLEFSDFDERLAEFESNVKSEEDFEFLAKNIYHEATKSVITQILWDLALQQGYAGPTEEKIIRKLQAWWKE